MAQVEQTEAECLLQGGAPYRSRVGLAPTSRPADLLFAGFKRGVFSLYFGDSPIYHFDLEGRWQRAYIANIHYLKSLDTSVYAIERVRQGANLVLLRRSLNIEEIRDLDSQVRGTAQGLIAELNGGRLHRREPPIDKAEPLDDADLRDFLVTIVRWDGTEWDAHHRLFLSTYGSMSFLPPDCQNAVVLQATSGSPTGLGFGNCPASVHVTRSPAEFQRHVQDVARLLGRRLVQTRIAFLASGDVLRRPADDVMSYLEFLGRTFSIALRGKSQVKPDSNNLPSIESIYTFLDDFRPPLPGPEEFQVFRRCHLGHISLGVESGSARVRGLYGKSWREDDLRALVADAKSAGIALSVLTLVGAGGEENSESHVHESAQLFISLGLSRGDSIFLLDERQLAGIGTESGASNAQIEAPWARRQDALRQALLPLRSQGVRVLTYSLEKQWA
jgi:hypothetical protein